MTVNGLEELKDVLGSNEKIYVLIYKSGSEQSDCAVDRALEAEKEGKFKLALVDVTKVKDIHPEYKITTAPSLLEFTNGRLGNIFKGCQTPGFYKSVFSGSSFASTANAEGKAAKRVTVYTTPTCTWCNTIKVYFKEKNINFTEVDVASNPTRAEEMVRKSGQQGVPQTDINGQMVIGFDKKRINELLEIQ